MERHVTTPRKKKDVADLSQFENSLGELEKIVERMEKGEQTLEEALRDIETRCLEYAAGLPQRETLETTWEGVLFSVGGHPLIAPLGEVKEIINYTADITPVPGTRSWLLGVANVRGNLLPVVDLQAYLLGRSTVSGRRRS